MSKPWFLIECQNRALADAADKDGERVAEIYILEEIGQDWWTGDGVAAKEFIEAVRALGEVDRIELHVSSPGGSVVDGLAIYNFLRQHPAPVTAYVDGIAASIASVIVMAGDEVVMPENALLMIHDPWSVVVGNAADLRKTADDLDKIKAGIVAAYVRKTGLPRDEVGRLMSEESWLTAAEAVELGFADRTDEPILAAALVDPEAARAEVDRLVRDRLAPPAPEPKGEPAAAPEPPAEPPRASGPDPAEIAALCREAGVPELTALALERRAPRAEVTRWLGWLLEARTACMAAGVPEADALDMVTAGIEGGIGAAIRRALAHAQAAFDGPDIQTRIRPDAGPKAPNVFDIYKRRAAARHQPTDRR